MHTLRRFCSRRGPGLSLLVTTILTFPAAAQSAPDTSGAAQAMRDYRAAVAMDAGRLWGHRFDSPLILVDPGTRTALASEKPPGGVFEQRNGIWEGRLPDGIPTANFALSWSGRRWAMVLLPLPRERFLAVQLLLHESFHGIQEAVGLGRMDYLNAHLDERDGRYWLRLELRALAAALEGKGGARDRAARDAMVFRAVRLARYPGADTLENSLEVAEGLAEYTGTRLALDYLKMPASRAAQLARDFEGRKTYVRSLGYGTGPGLGLLLDHYQPGWRKRVGAEGLAPMLAARLRVSPRDTAGVAALARRYGADSLAVEEDRRAEARARQLADYRARLIDGPVMVLRQDGLGRAFNPNELIPAGADGTIYPTGTFNGPWGTLGVTKGGALVAGDFRMVRLPAPRSATGTVIEGEGWKLELAEGWKLVPGDRAGDWVAVKE